MLRARYQPLRISPETIMADLAALRRGFSCHPSLLNSGGQRVHVLRKQHDLPYLTVRQRLAEGGHSGKANAVSNLPVSFSLRIILYTILGKLWWVRC